MARFSRRSFSFTNGEVSPLLFGRADMEFYFSALGTCLNWIPDHKGNLHRRPPTIQVSKRLVSQSECPAFYPFIVGLDCPTLIVAFSDRFEFIRDRQVVLDENGVAVTVAHDFGANYASLGYAQECAAMFFVHPDHRPQLLEKTETGFVLNDVDQLPFGDINNDEDCKLQLGIASTGSIRSSTSFDCEVGQEITFKRPDTTVITGGEGSTETIVEGEEQTATVIANLGGGICEFSGTLEAGTYEACDESGTSLGSVTLVRSSAALTASGCAPFNENMVGQQIRVLDENGDTTEDDDSDGNIWVTGTVLSVESSISLTLSYDGPSLVETDLFQLPAFSDGVFPTAVWIQQDRLWYGYGNRVAGSTAGNFDDWEPTDTTGDVLPTNAIYVQINSGSCSEVRWFWTIGRQLVVGTTDGTYSLLGAGANGAFQADATGQQLNDNRGVAAIRPVQVGQSIVYIGETKQKVYATSFGSQFEQLSSEELTLFADHIGDKRIIKFAYQEEPYKVIWGITEDGDLVSVTYDPLQSVRGWSRHELGGRLNGAFCDTNPRICDIDFINRSDERQHDVYMVVQRTMGGVDYYSIEVMEDFFDTQSSVAGYTHLDARVEARNTIPHENVVFSNMVGPEGSVNLDDGDYRLFDGSDWYGFSVAGSRFQFEAGIDDDPLLGRDWIMDDAAEWHKTPKPSFCNEGEYIGTTDKERFFRPPVAVVELLKADDASDVILGFGDDDIIIYNDGNIQNGLTGGLVRAGYDYNCDAFPLPFRQSLGRTDGANDQSHAIEVSLLLYGAVNMMTGDFSVDEVNRRNVQGNEFEIPPSETGRIVGTTDWVVGRPSTPINMTNAQSEWGFRANGPSPAIVRGMEAIIYASGGR